MNCRRRFAQPRAYRQIAKEWRPAKTPQKSPVLVAMALRLTSPSEGKGQSHNPLAHLCPIASFPAVCRSGVRLPESHGQEIEEANERAIRLMKKRTVTVNDTMQRGYRYQLVEPAGRNFDPEFHPRAYAQQMLQLGVFGGKYMTDVGLSSPIVGRGREARYCRQTVRSITLVSMRASRCPPAHGFTPTIHVAGFSGTAATTWAAARRKKTTEYQPLESNATARPGS